MSEDQLNSLLGKLKEDENLLQKLKAASSLEAAVSFAREAGFDVTKEDWLSHQARESLQLRDEDLENVAGGANRYTEKKTYCGGDSCIRKDGSESCGGW